MRKSLLVAAFALVAAPTGALAAKPSHPTHPATPVSISANVSASVHATKPPLVLFVLRGTLSHYTAASGSTNGSISIKVKSSNYRAGQLHGQTLTFSVNSKTNVVLQNATTVADNDRGIVKVRAPQRSSAATLQTKTALQVIDQGPSV